ncbi:MAG: radical SAM protein, partial [Desulfobacula sp.]|nr:radical SAM protein [Desulfobacula sp.]
MKKQDKYQGFEQGPIRPPSEASSLLIRLTRNCPWNRCTFCRVYKKAKFSLRSMENIIKDIDSLYNYVETIKQNLKSNGYISNKAVNKLFNSLEDKDRVAFNAAVNWYATGMKSIFLQDANSMIIKPDDLVYILQYLKKCFPDIDRITTYARSHTIVRIRTSDLQRMADAGLNRVHIGMESGSDIVLKKINKGIDKAGHIKAGLKIKKAG